MTAAPWPSLVDVASSPYRRAGHFAWRFARGKLSLDPAFRHLLSQGLIAPRARVLDIGCGQGLLASLLQAAEQSAHTGRWPQGWAPAPAGAKVTGIDLMPKDIERARAALGDSASFVGGVGGATTRETSSTLANGVPWLIGRLSTSKPSVRKVAIHCVSGRPYCGVTRWPRTKVTTLSTHWLTMKPRRCPASPTRSSSRPPGASAARTRASTASCSGRVM